MTAESDRREALSVYDQHFEYPDADDLEVLAGINPALAQELAETEMFDGVEE